MIDSKPGDKIFHPACGELMVLKRETISFFARNSSNRESWYWFCRICEKDNLWKMPPSVYDGCLP